VDVNENVGAGTPVAVLTSGEEPEVQVSIPESLITQLSVGQDGTVRFDAVPGETFPAVVTEVGVAASAYGTTFPVTVRLREPEPRIRPGMAAEVAFTFPAPDDRPRFYLPAGAVQEDRDGRFVYTLNETGDNTGVTRRAEVTTGELTSDGIEVFSGIEEGQKVVTAGAPLLTAGVTVRVPDNPEAF
jgi:RND family efflux transporter MFP subunit